MVTLTATQTDSVYAIKDLHALEHDAIEAYQTAITRLKNEEYRKQLASFKDEHTRHAEELSAFLKIVNMSCQPNQVLSYGLSNVKLY